MWTARAKRETGRAARTWFGTLTLSPDAHYANLCRARMKMSRQGLDYDLLPYGEQFVLLHNEAGREITLMLKRLRKATKSPFVYLCVAEAHKSGLPHYHLLVHERSHALPIRKAQLDAEWRIGFCKWRLVTDLRQATYLCKYLSKSTAARVRASVRYGEDDDLGHSEHVNRPKDHDEKASPSRAAAGHKTLLTGLRPERDGESLAFVLAAVKEDQMLKEKSNANSVSETKPE